jgi:hypothetical protein
MRVPGGKWWLWLAALVIVAAAGVLYTFPPDQYAFYPRCAFYAITGLKCPGCGGLRAVHYLLHGNIAAAIWSNPLVVFLPQVVLLGLGCYAVFRRAGRPLPSLWEHPEWLWVVLSVVIAFGVVRNLPFARGF